jgi:hypothetical protein
MSVYVNKRMFWSGKINMRTENDGVKILTPYYVFFTDNIDIINSIIYKGK